MLDFRETVGFAVFLAGVGLGLVSGWPLTALAWWLGWVRWTPWTGVRPHPRQQGRESPAERLARMDAEYREAAGRG